MNMRILFTLESSSIDVISSVGIGMMDEKGKLKLKGVSPKMLKRMKLEAVDCPVFEKELGFIQCYVCSNFHSRVMGKVYCKGEPLS